jgi:hypothetical protein
MQFLDKAHLMGAPKESLHNHLNFLIEKLSNYLQSETHHESLPAKKQKTEKVQLPLIFFLFLASHN